MGDDIEVTSQSSTLQVGAKSGAPTFVGDADLLRDYRAGDRSALAMLHERYFRALVARAYRMVGNPTDAEDIASEAFLQVIRAIDAGKGPTVSMWRYLLTTVRSVAISQSSASDPLTLEPLRIQEIVDLQTSVPSEGSLDEVIMSAFTKLPERWRLVIWCREVEGYSQHETGSVLGINENAVGALTLRARRGFRAEYLKSVLRSNPSRSCARFRQQLVRQYTSEAPELPKPGSDLEEHLESCRACSSVLIEAREVVNRFGRTMSLALVGGALGGSTAGGLLHTSVDPASATPIGNGATRSTSMLSKKSLLAIGAVAALSIVAMVFAQGSTSRSETEPTASGSGTLEHATQNPLVLDFPVEETLLDGKPSEPIQLSEEKTSGGSCGVTFMPVGAGHEEAYFEQSSEGSGECRIQTSRNGNEIADFQMSEGVRRIYVKRADTYSFMLETDRVAPRTLTIRVLPEFLEE